MPALQSLRFLCIVFVMLNHVGYDETTFVGRIPLTLCEASVAFFFMLSGYVLTRSYGERLQQGSVTWTAFMRSRLRKLYPLHAICLALFLLLIVRHLDVLDFRALLANLLLVQSWIPVHDIYYSCNGVSWYLSALVFCYALFPHLHRWLSGGSARRVLCTCIVALLLYALLLLFNTDAEAFVYVAPYSRIFDFALGILMARFMAGRQVPTRPLRCGVLALALLLMLAIMVGYQSLPASVRQCSIYWPVCLAMLFAYGVPAPAQEQPNAVRRTLRRLGQLSYPFYMVHVLVLWAVTNAYQHVFPAPMSYVQAALATFIGSLTLAYAYNYFITSKQFNHKR